MKFACVLILLLIPVMSLAEPSSMLVPERGEFLPVAKGRVAVPFVQAETAVPVQTGATVEFVSVGGLKIRELVWAKGYVLGTRSGVVLLEVPSNTAVNLAKALKRLEVRLRTKELPDPDVIALRLKHRDDDHGILLAPRLLSFTVNVEISTEHLAELRPGRSLSIGRDGESVDVHYISNKRLEDGNVQMTLAAREKPAIQAIRLNEAGALAVLTSKRGEWADRERKCFIVRRQGTERIHVRIPCTH